MLELGTLAPHFSLPDTEGNIVSLDDFPGTKPLLMVFMCNHCPFVIHIRKALSTFAKEYLAKGLSIVGVNANDTVSYPADSPAMMKREVKLADYTFPYLFDESQSVAKAYQAACTPDFFLFDKARKLVYRGQFDDSRPGNGKTVTGADLRNAVDALLEGAGIPTEQKPGIGCNIKWKRGNEPDYFV